MDGQRRSLSRFRLGVGDVVAGRAEARPYTRELAEIGHSSAPLHGTARKFSLTFEMSIRRRGSLLRRGRWVSIFRWAPFRRSAMFLQRRSRARARSFRRGIL